MFKCCLLQFMPGGNNKEASRKDRDTIDRKVTWNASPGTSCSSVSAGTSSSDTKSIQNEHFLVSNLCKI